MTRVTTFRRAVTVAVMAAAVAATVLVANLMATLVSWKVALAADAAAVTAAPLLWRRTPERAWLMRATTVLTAVACVAVAALFSPAWRDHARHDERLAAMAATLCATDLPEGARIGSCSGSITNTGNGNSCRYLVTAAVAAPSSSALIDHLRDEGFEANELDVFGEPMHDGKTYWRDGDQVRIALMSSWQDDANDLRCK